MDQEAEALDAVAEKNVEEDFGASEVDASALSAALQHLAAAEMEQAAEELKRKKELEAVTVNKQDLETVMSEFDLDKTEADLLLRESAGDLKKTLLRLVQGGIKTK